MEKALCQVVRIIENQNQTFNQDDRPEGPKVSRPGRQAGNGIEAVMSAEGAALRTPAGAGPLGLALGYPFTPS